MTNYVEIYDTGVIIEELFIIINKYFERTMCKTSQGTLCPE